MERENERLLTLYELAIREEHYFLDRHQSRIAFYSGILSALLAGTAAGVYKATEWYQLILLLIAPPIIFLISAMAITTTFRIYRVFLETVTIRAKIEQTLGLTKASRSETETSGQYWHGEPVIPQRYIRDREAYDTSDAFVTGRGTKGYQAVAVRFFRSFQMLSVLMFAGILVALLVWKVL